jgi:hypothetical protein
MKRWGSRGEGNKPAAGRRRQTQKKSNSSTSVGGNVSQPTVAQGHASHGHTSPPTLGQTSDEQTPQPAQEQALQATEGQKPPADAQKKGRTRATTASSNTTAGP